MAGSSNDHNSLKSVVQSGCHEPGRLLCRSRALDVSVVHERSNKALNDYFVHSDDLLAIRLLFKTAKRWLTCQWFIDVSRRLQGKVVSQLLMIVQVFITQCQSINSLTKDCCCLMLAAGAISWVMDDLVVTIRVSVWMITENYLAFFICHAICGLANRHNSSVVSKT